MKQKKIALCALLLAMTLLLTACEGLPWNRRRTIPDDDEGEDPNATPVPTPEVVSVVTDDRFTIKYDPDDTLNPIYCTGSSNNAITMLMYETLYSVDSHFKATPLLVERAETEDGQTWKLFIRRDVIMHDGKPLTASDVVYSLYAASESDKYSVRFEHMDDCYAEDDYTVLLQWDMANYSLPQLLDIPVIREGSAEERVPPGSGPFSFTRTITGGRLTASKQYRDSDSLPVRTIYLVKPELGQETMLFTDSRLDLLSFDPTGYSLINVRVAAENHYYDTPILQYLGFNDYGILSSDYRFRRAVYYAIDRSSIADAALSGAAVASPLVLSPVMDGYSRQWEPEESYSMLEYSKRLAAIGMRDSNSDGYLEYPVDDAMWEVSVRFIVNSENSYKAAAAEMIADSIRSMGIHVILDELSWKDFNDALVAGNYDIYYGEVRLTPDFDLSPLVSAGAEVNYGFQQGISDVVLTENLRGGTSVLTAEEIFSSGLTSYENRIFSFLGTQGSEHAQAAQELCEYFLEDSYVIPILYKRHSVLVHRGVVTGLAPSIGNIFYDFPNWSITLKKESAE